MLEVIYGGQLHPNITNQLVASIRNIYEGRYPESSATLYIGYPLVSLEATSVVVDALLVSKEHGLVIFDLASDSLAESRIDFLDKVDGRQLDLEAAFKSKLLENRNLRRRADLAIEVNVISVVVLAGVQNADAPPFIVQPENIDAVISRFKPISIELYTNLNASIERTTTLRPALKRENAITAGSRGSILKIIESKIANLDRWQKAAAIETPAGIQRIRGLAGSGKTIVLAQKASYLLTLNPRWNILVSFYTQSLYQQFRRLIRQFHIQFSKDEPDWGRLQLMHCWGSAGRDGLHRVLCRKYGVNSVDFGTAQSRYGSNAFAGICAELIPLVERDPNREFLDAVLIDEAQDMPKEFFQLVYLITKSPKRIVYAYDELQTLNDYTMPSVDELFGTLADGTPRIQSLRNEDSRPRQDIILPVCYRNTLWSLTVAHATGFGIYRKPPVPNKVGFVQMFDQPELWTDIGYERREGALEEGRQVTLARKDEATPAFFAELLEPEDAFVMRNFDSNADQFEWVAAEIGKNLKEQELLPQDILIIVCDQIYIRSIGNNLMSALRKHGVQSHIAGITTSQSEFFRQDSVTISHIYRAKGNEAPMVYIIGAETCFSGIELIKRRNVLFTAITRSRAWVRVCGVGPYMQALIDEMQQVAHHNYQLAFRYPTRDEIADIRKINRDRSVEEKKTIGQRVKNVGDLLDDINRGELSPDVLSPEIREALRRWASSEIE